MALVFGQGPRDFGLPLRPPREKDAPHHDFPVIGSAKKLINQLKYVRNETYPLVSVRHSASSPETLTHTFRAGGRTREKPAYFDVPRNTNS